MSSTSISPNWREILYARSSITGHAENLTSTNNRLDVNATIGPTPIPVLPPMTPGVDFNYLSVANTDTTTDTLTYKSGGSGGTTVQTIVVTYPNSITEKLSSSVSTMEWS